MAMTKIKLVTSEIKRIYDILSNHQHPILLIISRFLMKTGISKFIIIKRSNFNLRFYPSSLSATLWIDPSFGKEDEMFYLKYLKTGDHVVDVGANIGSLTLLASTIVGETGIIYAIEAHPRIFSYLQKNIFLNDKTNIISFNYAIGDKKGEVILSDLKGDDKNSISSDNKGILVRMKRLDDLPLKWNISLLKIDVEGYELFVFRGAENILEHTACIYFESWDKHFSKYNYTCNDVFAFLNKKGFHIFKIMDNDLIRIDKDYVSTRCENLIAAKDINSFLQRTGIKLKK